jgi:diadenosine tetraphosphatase ApaH/serine/threonine PP2A family protein phosphatase
MDAFAALERVENARAEILFCGHTHQPYIRELADGSIAVKIKNAVPKDTQEKEIQLPMRRIVNAGSVGEPRHGGTKATYVVYNDVTNEVKIREVEYDIELTCKAIIDAGLPPIFAWRLKNGFEFAEQAEDASHVCER